MLGSTMRNHLFLVRGPHGLKYKLQDEMYCISGNIRCAPSIVGNDTLQAFVDWWLSML